MKERVIKRQGREGNYQTGQDRRDKSYKAGQNRLRQGRRGKSYKAGQHRLWQERRGSVHQDRRGQDNARQGRQCRSA